MHRQPDPTNSAATPDSVALLVTDHVSSEDAADYERLVSELRADMHSQPGFQSAVVLRHPRARQTEYSVLVRFRDSSSLAVRRNAPEFDEKLAAIHALTGGEERVFESTGLELSVDHAAGDAAPTLPPYWKPVLLGILGVCPTLLLMLALAGPITRNWPQPTGVLLVVAIASMVLTWTIVPTLSKALGPWLNRPTTTA